MASPAVKASDIAFWIVDREDRATIELMLESFPLGVPFERLAKNLRLGPWSEVGGTVVGSVDTSAMGQP